MLDLLHATFREDTVFARQHGVPRISDPATALGIERLHTGETAAGGQGFDYDIPSNRSSSDLTAQRVLHPRDSAFAVVPHDLHVT